MISVLLAGLHKILPIRLSDIWKIWTLPTHRHLYYWIINFIIQIRTLMMSVKHSHQNSKSPTTTAKLKHRPAYLPFLLCQGPVICLHHHFSFSCRLDTDVFSFPFLSPSISHTSAPRNEDKEKKASSSTCLWWNDFLNSVAWQSSHQFWKGHCFLLVHKFDGNLRDLLSSSIDIS